MRLRDIIGLGLALVLAIGVALLTRYFLAKEETQKEPKVQQVELTRILVASKSLHEGDTVHVGDLIWQQWPQNALNANYIKEGSVKVEDLGGAVVRYSVENGEPVVLSDFVKSGEKGILAAIVTPGKRAISIDVTAQSASSGLISPGDHVDVIMAKVSTGAAGGQQGESKTIVKNVKVLAVDIETGTLQGKPKVQPHVATLEVTPQEAEEIVAASKDGTLSLSLHSLSTQEVPTPTVEVSSNEAPPKEKKGKEVILFRGKEEQKIEIPTDGEIK